jgi:hypothetical protein
MPVQQQYFSNWGNAAGQAIMFIPESPFCPAEDKCGKKKKSKKCKKKKKGGKKKHESSSEEEEYEEEIYVLKKPGNQRQGHESVEYTQTQKPSRQVPNDLIIYAPQQVGDGYGYGDYQVQPPMMIPGGYEMGPEMMDGYNFYPGPGGADDYLMAAEQQRAAEEMAAAQYEADLQAADQYNAAMAAQMDPGMYGPPAQMDPGMYGPPAQMDPGMYGPPDPMMMDGPPGPDMMDPSGFMYPPGAPGANYDYYGSGGPMVNGYGQMVDGLGYYP